jgi:hypothetical protein
MLHFCDFGATDPPSLPPSGSGLFACLLLAVCHELHGEKRRITNFGEKKKHCLILNFHQNPNEIP